MASNPYMSKPFFFVVLLLCVLLSVCNIRDAMTQLPVALDSGTIDETIWNNEDKFREETSTNSNRTIIEDLPITTSTFDDITTSNKETSTDIVVNTTINTTIIKDHQIVHATTALNVATSNKVTNNKTIVEDLPITTDPFDVITPNNDNTVISLVSMGRLVDTFLVERCIRTIRRRGLFLGTILVFTDDIGYQRYQHSILPWDNRTRIIEGRNEDLYPMEEIEEENEKNVTTSSVRPKKYAQETMIFKRFKTHHAKYISEDPAIVDSAIRYVLYVDVDNIIGAPLSVFFQDYVRTVTDEVEQISKNNSDHGFSFVSMFRDKHLRGKMHSGVILFDLLHQDRCVNGWRNEMDSFWHASDQTMLLRVLDNYDRYRCRVFALVHGHIAFANKRLMTDAANANANPNMTVDRNKRRRKKLTLPTFVHVTNYRVKRINNATIHEGFLRYVLDLKDNETLVNDTSWEQVVSPTGKRTI